MKKTIIAVCALLLVFGLTGLGHSADIKKGIRIGNAGAFTGDAAAPCMEIFNSAQIAVDEWNAKGGMMPWTRPRASMWPINLWPTN